MKKSYKLIFGLIIAVNLLAASSAEQIQLKPIELSGKEGGYANGKVWKSNSLLRKTNILFYIDPDKIADIKQFVSDLESKKSQTNNVGITYIVNTKATLVPTFSFRLKLKRKQGNLMQFLMYWTRKKFI